MVVLPASVNVYDNHAFYSAQKKKLQQSEMPEISSEIIKEKREKKNTCKKISRSELQHHLGLFFISRKKSCMEYCEDKPFSYRTFQRHAKESGVIKMRKDHPKSRKEAKNKIRDYVEQLEARKTERGRLVGKRNKILTPEEEELMVNICATLGALGHGVDKNALECIINAHVSKGSIGLKHGKYAISRSVVSRILREHKSLAKLVSGNPMDTARANQAKSNVRDTVFKKLDCYIKLLFRQGKVCWNSYRDVPKQNIYNMDEVGIDTTRNKCKIIVPKGFTGRIFTRECQGDGKMSHHLSAAITTRADGTINLVLYQFIICII